MIRQDSFFIARTLFTAGKPGVGRHRRSGYGWWTSCAGSIL